MRNHLKFAVLAVDIAVLTIEGDDLKVLLAPAKSETFKGQLALPGGLINPRERAEKAAKRILESVLTNVDFYMEQLYTFDSLSRDPLGRVVSVAYLMLIPRNRARLIIKEKAAWFSVKSLPKLAYDHNEIVKTAVKRLMGKLSYTNIVFSLIPEEFSLTELQSTYESVLDKSLDKRNFRKKMKALGILKKIPKKRRGEANRPAQLYSFAESGLREVEIL